MVSNQYVLASFVHLNEYCSTDPSYEVVSLSPRSLMGVRHRATAERGHQTGDRGGVSEAGEVIDVIGTDHTAGEFLQEIVLFIGALGRGQKRDTVGTILLLDFTKLRGHEV